MINRLIGKISRNVDHRITFAAACSTLILLLAAGAVSALPNSDQWQPVKARPGCAYRIQPGQWLSHIVAETGTPMSDIVATNNIRNPDLIQAGAVLDVCTGSGAKPKTVAPDERVQRLTVWARHVIATKPIWANDDHVRFLVAVAGPESASCDPRYLENKGDARATKWGPSVGCIQIRTLQPSHAHLDPRRDRAWLEQTDANIAEAGWSILYEQGRTAWGPARWGRQSKLQNDCAATISPSKCRTYWANADAAIEAAAR